MIQFELIDPAGIIGTDLGRTMRRGLKSVAADWMMAENRRVQERTPQSSGALASDEVGDYNTDPDDEEIFHLYTIDTNQVAAHGKQYAVFVEGPMLGDNGMWSDSLWAQGYNGAHMYEDVYSDDTDLFEEFGITGLNAGIDLIVSGQGDR